MLNKIDAWHSTKPGLLAFGLVELGIAYGFASLSIDRGNFWWYLLTLVFLVGALRNFAGLIGGLFHVRRPDR